MVLIWLIKRVFYKFFWVRNEWKHWFNLLSKKPRHNTQWSKRLLWNDKERLRKEARDKYRNLSEEKKIKKENMGRID